MLTNTLPETFVGREEVLGVLNKRVEALKSGYRQNVALTGQKLCGKTSILQHFLANLKDASIIPVYIEVLNEPLEIFSKKFIGTMLFNFFKNSFADTKEDLDFLIKRSQDLIPKTAFSIKEIFRLLGKADYQEAYSSLFNLTSVLREETQKSCIIILDEFHNLSFFNLKNPFAIFGKKIMVQKDTMYVVTSSQVSSIKKILKEKLDLLFGNFEVIEIKDFDNSLCRKFFERRLEGIKLQDELEAFLISLTDGRPFYMDIIASKLIDIAAQLHFKWLSTPHIAQSLEDLLFDSKGTINQYFQNLLSGLLQSPFANDYLDILSAIADGKRKSGEIRSCFNGKKSDIPARIKKLEEENFIAKNGFFYYFNDKVFEFWLKYVYNRERYSLLSKFQDRADSFKKEVEGLVSVFTEEAKQNIYDRVKGLLAAFNNEILVIGTKSLKFPRFISIDVENISEGSEEFFIRASYELQKFWILQFSHQYVDEGRMVAFVERFKEIAPITQKKVLIALSGVDTNTRLIAKENKILLWERESLNLILSLYGKSKILV